MSDEKKIPPRKDRIRAKKGSHKLTERQVEMSIRQIAKWFARKNHYQIKISPAMVHGILTGKMHKKEDKVSIYDLINEDVTDEELENLNPKDVKYE
jgi:hypothetical protein